MREIKFRGKRLDNDEWVYGNLIGNDRIVGEIVEWDDEYFCTEFWYVVDPETVGQYTGLKDRNGKEVYEGDFVKGTMRSDEDYKRVQQVTFVKGCFMFGNWNAHEYFNKHTRIEVIGSIHENTELIEVQA